MPVSRPGGRAGSMGYTLVELVLVIVIAAVLAAITGQHFFDQPTFAQRGFADELAGALRFAQKKAIATDCPTRVTVSAGAYAVAQQAAAGNTCNPSDATWSTPALALDGSAVADSAPNGVTVSPTGSFVFNGAGVLASSPALSLTVGSHSISIDATTGFVQVQ